MWQCAVWKSEGHRVLMPWPAFPLHQWPDLALNQTLVIIVLSLMKFAEDRLGIFCKWTFWFQRLWSGHPDFWTHMDQNNLCLCVCMWRPGDNLQCPSIGSVHLVCLCLPWPGITGSLYASLTFTWIWGIWTGPHAGAAWLYRLSYLPSPIFVSWLLGIEDKTWVQGLRDQECGGESPKHSKQASPCL